MQALILPGHLISDLKKSFTERMALFMEKKAGKKRQFAYVT